MHKKRCRGLVACSSDSHMRTCRRARRERAAGMYGVLPFGLAQQLVEIPYLVVQAAVYSCIVYW